MARLSFNIIYNAPELRERFASVALKRPLILPTQKKYSLLNMCNHTFYLLNLPIIFRCDIEDMTFYLLKFVMSPSHYNIS